MKRKLIFPLLLATGLAASNLSSFKRYEREFGVTSEGFDPAMLGIIFCFGAIFFLGGRSLKSIAKSLGEGIIKLKKRKVEFVFSILILCPLFLQFRESTKGILTDGTSYIYTIAFGGDHSGLLFILGLATIILFQNQIDPKNKMGEPVGRHNSGKRSALTSA
ncbi:hypothetical protein [Pelagicoccus albus]|uniref:Uncharacterized protein n=1 Tax=Pelagicoccus albus TaxID=415222 RepID=A0A7X1B378_9BACT|nr:hypothetical protein [Pelagicoccus albus]MBC2604825.1 hypothetical protein [Pelagicoccus albus]